MTDAGSKDDADQRLLLEALVVYSDSCTLPDLTPSCPYYVVVSGFPSCNEECVDAITARGGTGRSVGEVKTGGLLMKGRTVPLRAAGPSDSFDAMSAYMRERSLPAAEQSTGTLLLALGAVLNEVPWLPKGDDYIRASILWAELDRRHVPVESVVRGAVIPQIATQIGILAAVPMLRASGLWDDTTSDDELDRMDLWALKWTEVLQHAFDLDGGEIGVSNRIDQWIDAEETMQHMADIFRPMGSLNLGDSALELPQPEDVKVPDMRVIYALSNRFRKRVEQWLSSLLADDLRSVVSWSAPPSAVFAALDPVPTADEVGVWVWDRFTHTNLEEWATPSLVREWTRNEDGELNQRVWLERACEADKAGALALGRVMQKKHQPALQPPQLSADSFVKAAIQQLESGSPSAAAEIFAGLVELRPTDGDALNNLGFCLMPIDPDAALAALQRSSLYPMKPGTRMINACNRVLALHLVGRSHDALTFARESANIPTARDDHHCYAWTIEDKYSDLRLRWVNPQEYLGEIAKHLEAALDLN